MTPTPDNHKVLALWAADCAEHILAIFENRHPEDKRPREAIEAARAWARGEMAMTDARKAAFVAHAAAREAEQQDARAAARAAGHAAATAHVAAHSPHAADYAIKAAADPTAERQWQAAQRRLRNLPTP